jgi:Asp-tRNA(Asn)/Glu-tRNA(Gln) amidotransferase A subunit family amidase
LPDATSGPDPGDPYWAPPPHPPVRAEGGANPWRPRIGFTTRAPEGDLGHPDCVAAAGARRAAVFPLGHEVTEIDWPGFTPGSARPSARCRSFRRGVDCVVLDPGTPAASWRDEIEPLNWALWQAA